MMISEPGSLLDKVVAVLCNRKDGEIEEMGDSEKGVLRVLVMKRWGDGWRVSEAGCAGWVVGGGVDLWRESSLGNLADFFVGCARYHSQTLNAQAELRWGYSSPNTLYSENVDTTNRGNFLHTINLFAMVMVVSKDLTCL
jgi:hypothetical protein